jgi:molecular chaperone DnaK
MADSTIYATEKSIKEVGGSLDESAKRNIEMSIEKLRKAMEGDNTEEIKRLTEELTQASHKVAEAMYAKASAEQGRAGGSGESGSAPHKDDDVVDADFEEVKK